MDEEERKTDFQLWYQSNEIFSDIRASLETMTAEDLKAFEKIIDDNVRKSDLRNKGYISVTTKKDTVIPKVWLDTNIKGPYDSVGDVWFFLDKKDAAWFLLTWK